VSIIHLNIYMCTQCIEQLYSTMTMSQSCITIFFQDGISSVDLWISIEDLSYTAIFFALSCYSSCLSYGAKKSCLPLLHRLIVVCHCGDINKVHCQEQ
jgi:hypothetical protein